jgi:cytochrome c oxidase cbb3-type subunit III
VGTELDNWPFGWTSEVNARVNAPVISASGPLWAHPDARCVASRDVLRVYRGYTVMTRSMKWLTSVLLACSPVFGQSTEPGPQPKASPADVAQGERTYGSECSFCHGPKGEGALGPALAVPRIRRAPTDQALFQIIREGIAGTQMPPSTLATAQIWQLVAYVRSLGHIQQTKSTGDPKRGAQIYAGKGGCAQCHAIAGHGGAIGPDLSDAGARLDRDFLRASLVTPEASIPRDFMQVRLITKDGQSLTGVRVNEDTFSIQIRDLSNRLHSFWKTELTELVKEPNRSPMPSYSKTLTPEELDNLVAYLESLEGN